MADCQSRFIELFGDPIKNTQHRPTTDFVNVVTMQRGFDLPVQDREQSGNIPVYGSNGVLDHHNQAKVCNGGVITGRSGTIGKVFYTKGAYWPLNTTLFSVDTHENNIIYLAHLLRMFNLARFTEGTGVPTLNRNKFHSAPIIDVPIDEQNQFAAFVEQTDKSRFIELFGDPVSNSMGLPTEPMTTVCAIIDGDRGKNYPKQDEFSDTGYCLFLNAKNVTATGFSFENRMFITKEKDDALHNGKLERGDVVLTTRGTLGNLAFYDDSVPFENVRINSGMVILRMKKSVMTEVFFMEQFKLQLQSIKGKIASGSAQPQLPISTMNKIRILLAPMALQEQFAAFVEQTDKSKLCGKMEVAA